MTHRKGAVWTERLVLALILASLGGTLNLVVAIHRRVHSPSMATKSGDIPPPSPPAVLKSSPTAHQAASPARPPRKAEAPPIPPVPVEDPTAPILARLNGAIIQEAEAAREADRRAAAMEKARQASVSESQGWKRREMLVHQQVAALGQRAEKLEQDALTIEAERDVLARERDALKAALAKSSQQSGYAVLPYKGPNGTWRRPIVLECTGTTVKLQPHGPSFSMMDLSPLIHPRASPIILAIAREMMHIQQAETPDGAPAVPYLVFLVRPDGIRPYYQARARLEPLGIAFGYELVEQDLAIDIPDFDDVRTWDGTKPLEIAGGDTKPRGGWPPPAESSPRGDSREGSTWPGGDRAATADTSGPGTWPPTGDSQGKPGFDRRSPDLARGDRPGAGMSGWSGSTDRGSGDASTPEIDLGGNPRRGNSSDGRQSGGSGDGSPDDFVWPTTSGGTSPAGTRGTGRGMGRPSADGAGLGNGSWVTPPAGLGGRGTSPSSGSPSLAGGGSGYDRIGRSPVTPGGGSNASQPGEGQPPSGMDAGRLLARGGETGRANISSPGAGPGPGAPTSGRGNATGSEGGIPDPLPDLEPARDGISTFGTPMPGGASGAGGSGRAGFGRSGPSPSATMGGSSADATGENGIPSSSLPGQPGNLNPPAGPDGPNAIDRGFAPYVAGASSPGQGGLGSGSISGDRMASPGVASAPGAPGSPPTTDPGKTAASEGGQPGSDVGSGSMAASATAGGANAQRSSSAMISGLPSSGSSSPLESSSMTGSAAPSQNGRPPSSIGSTVGGGSPPSSTSMADLFGGPPTSSTGSSFRSLGGATGSASSDSTASWSGTSSTSSSVSSAGSSGMAGGQPPSGMPAGASGMSLPSLNASPDPNSEPDQLKGLALPPIDTHRQPGAIDVPFEIVVVCRRDDLLLHPGGYRITAQSLHAGAGKGDNSEPLLERELRAIVRRRAQVDPLIRPKPQLKFLVEGGGAQTFWTARKQLTFSNLGWPMTVQVAGPQTGYLLDERIRR